MTERPPRPTRAEPREIVELRELKVSNPELASAVDMQIALVDQQRRIQARVPLPWIQPDPAWFAAQQEAGRPVVRFSDIPLDWTDFRLALRQTADILVRFEAIDRAEHEAILSLGRDGNVLEPLATQWYEATSRAKGAAPESPRPDGLPENLDQILLLAFRPFLARCAEGLMQRADLSKWSHGHCPICGWEPDFAVIANSGERRLICGRCTGQWVYGSATCPYCSNDDHNRVTSFTTRDGRYRVYACDVCRRYVKAFDSRNATRPLLLAVDVIATLPLDAAAIQKGYEG